jgi:cell division protein FtsZ
MDMPIEFIEEKLSATIKVIGVGGAGGNAVNNMIESGLKNAIFIAANTDAQALKRSEASTKIQLGVNITKGLGAGANPEVGRQSALENLDQIRESLEGSDMVFIAAGMGGGTGTGGAPIIAQVSKELGVLTAAIVTKPFFFEGKKRLRHAEQGISELQKVVDTIITIPNDRLLKSAPRNASLKQMFKKADEVLYYAVKGITDLITIPGLINVDFADVKTVMEEKGLALMGTGIAKGDSRAIEAAQRAIHSPLLEDLSISGARSVLINVTGSSEMTIEEVQEAPTLVQK